MTRSMTGFGKAAGESAGASVTVEISAVNHRYFDCNMRLPSAWAALETDLKAVVKEQVERGKLYVTVNRKLGVGAATSVKLDIAVARQYLDAAQELAGIMGTDERLSLNVLAGLEGVFYHEEDAEDLEASRETVSRILTQALQALNTMRETEGRALAEDVAYRIQMLREKLAEVELRLPELSVQYRERLLERIGELNAEASVTEERIAIEVALLAERADVTEEVVRLKTHFDHMLETLDSGNAIGRRLDFLTQEVLREINTLGVKTRGNDVARAVLDMKSEAEKIREQVQNIE